MFPSLLLVDDDENIVYLLKEILEEEGFEVDLAYNGVSAVQKITPGKYAAILLDFVLPDMRGDAVAEGIRGIDPGAGLILLTGFKHAIDPVKLKVFNRVLEKPAHPEKVLAAISEVLRERQLSLTSMVINAEN